MLTAQKITPLEPRPPFSSTRTDRSSSTVRLALAGVQQKSSEPQLANSGLDWPETGWRLTAPESYVLNYAGDGWGRDAFRLAVKELVARRALRVVPVGTRAWTGVRKERWALTEGPRLGTSIEPPLSPVLDLFMTANKRTFHTPEASASGSCSIKGVLVDDFAKAGRKRFGGFRRYRDDHVFSALVARGMMASERHMVMGVLPRKQKAWTDTGRAAVDDLEQWLQVGMERLGDWMSEDPGKAHAFTSDAGAMILLVGGLYAKLGTLEQQFGERWNPAGNCIGATARGEDPAAARLASSNRNRRDIDLAALRSEYGGFDGVESALRGIDMGIDAVDDGEGVWVGSGA